MGLSLYQEAGLCYFVGRGITAAGAYRSTEQGHEHELVARWWPMKSFLAKYNPGASVRTHLLVNALLWSGVGGLLMARGVHLMLGSAAWWLPLAALLVGTIKSQLILDRVASKNVQRTLTLQDGACIGGAYSWKTWGLVLFMAGAGRTLRMSSIPPAAIGAITVAIGWGLYLSSRLIWQQLQIR